MCCVQNFSQAADRRDRLIYVLSQINAARGDDAMHVDEESSEESDDEVRAFVIPFSWLGLIL
jgi:U4/U6 small nuclear ribonucleoprotein PRP4